MIHGMSAQKRLFLIIGTLMVCASGLTGASNTRDPPHADYSGSTDHGGVTANDSEFNIRIADRIGCRILPVDSHLHEKILQHLLRGVKLLEYTFSVENYTQNPLLTDVTWHYKANVWSRTSSRHGQTLLSLAFNYGVLSLGILTFGVEKVPVPLWDSPQGCFGELSEDDKMTLLLHLVLRDFKVSSREITYMAHEFACHQVIKNVQGYAQFADRCCTRKDGYREQPLCIDDQQNFWVQLLHTLLAWIKIAVVLFGPLMIPSELYSGDFGSIFYIVKLKEPLFRDMYVYSRDTVHARTVRGKHKIVVPPDAFPACKSNLHNIPFGKVIRGKVKEYHIYVDYKKLLLEYSVPVGLVRSLFRAICMCKLRKLPPFEPCCEASVLGNVKDDFVFKWKHIFKMVGRILLVVIIPLPFYVRLFLYYKYEHPELMERHLACYRTGLGVPYNNSIMQYLSPTHSLFIIIYVTYFITCVILTYLHSAKSKERHLLHFQKVLVGSFRDMGNVSYLNAMGMVISNFLRPFRKYGVFGVLFGVFYWPVVMPVCVLVFLCYFLPLAYLSLRMVFYSKRPVIRPRRRGAIVYELDRTNTSWLNRIRLYLSKKMVLDEISPKVKVPGAVEDPDDDAIASDPNPFTRRARQLVIGLMCTVSLYATMLMLAECVGFAVEIAVFTLMGIIVNAGSALRYVSLIFLVGLYSHDCYHSVYQQYLTLNKSLFSEIKGRIKQISEVTSLPSYLQENRGFKSVENSEQADYEQDDDPAVGKRNLWNINDLVFFVDSEDTPRMPRLLFEEACQIRVDGSPGPIHLSILYATGRFLGIIVFLLFVFVVVMSFGDIYRISSTNQMLATLAGGFLPFIFKNVMSAARPQLDIKTVSFKSKLDEIIQNFQQNWPMADFPFEEAGPDDEKKEGDDDADESNKDNKDKSAVSEEDFQVQDDIDSAKDKTLNNNGSPLPNCVPMYQYCNVDTVVVEEKRDSVDQTDYVDFLVEVRFVKQCADRRNGPGSDADSVL